MDLVILSVLLDVDMKLYALLPHYASVTSRSESMDFWFHVKLFDFVIFYFKHLVFQCLTQIVKVFRFVYYIS